MHMNNRTSQTSNQHTYNLPPAYPQHTINIPLIFIHPIGDTFTRSGEVPLILFFSHTETRFLALVPESAESQVTGTCPCILVYSRFRDQGQDLVLSIWKEQDKLTQKGGRSGRAACVNFHSFANLWSFHMVFKVFCLFLCNFWHLCLFLA